MFLDIVVDATYLPFLPYSRYYKKKSVLTLLFLTINGSKKSLTIHLVKLLSFGQHSNELLTTYLPLFHLMLTFTGKAGMCERKSLLEH